MSNTVIIIIIALLSIISLLLAILFVTLLRKIRSASKDNFNLIQFPKETDDKIKDLIVTRGSNGAILYNSFNKKYITCPAFASKVVDKVGAGDSMLSIMSILIKSKFRNIISLFLGSLAGALSVGEMSNKVPIKKTKLLKYFNHILR